MTKPQFVAALQKAIKASGLTYSEIARRAGLSPVDIQTLMRGHCPSVVRADAILGALGLRLVIGHVEGRKRLEV